MPEEYSGSAGNIEDSIPQVSQVKEIDENVDLVTALNTENQSDYEKTPNEKSVFDVNEDELEKLSPENSPFDQEETKISSPNDYSCNREPYQTHPGQIYQYDSHADVSFSKKEFDMNINTYRIQPPLARLFYPDHFDIFSPMRNGTQQNVGHNEGRVCVENIKSECPCCCKKYNS